MRPVDRKAQRKKRHDFYRRLLVLFFLCCGATYLVLRFFNPQKADQATRQSTEISREQTTASGTRSTSNSTVTIAESAQTTQSTTIAASQNETRAEPVNRLDPSRLLATAGQVSYGVHYFSTGETVAHDADQPMIAASVIKVFIMEYLYAQAAKNQVQLDQLINGESIRALVTRMIQVSDNTATNVLIAFFGMDALNAYFAERGYRDTSLQRLMLDEAAQQQGKENYTSLTDCLAFLQQLYQQQTQFPFNEMLTIMAGQQIATKIRRELPADVMIANKTGELPGVENDIGLVYGHAQPFAIVVLSNGVTDAPAMQAAIGNFTADALARGGG